MIKNTDIVRIATAGIAAGEPGETVPIIRKDEDMNMVVRVYVPDLEKMKTWQAPKAEMLKSNFSQSAKGRR